MLPFACGSDHHHVIQVGLFVSITSTVNGSVFDAFSFDASGTIKVFLSIKPNYKQINT
jgi:hypothetical protein